ncbi:hypothetical protein [Acuticoccus sp.]|uniref:hypothetical protein n=1 Tax=Acuticoccus sp. TaxID=1904378 RepID=UPI003B51DE57
MRAIVLYPMNALVEDQITRLRKAIDSPEAHEVMDARFAGNRIFFGRYTSATPVPGYLQHPRRAADAKEKRGKERRASRVVQALATMAEDQQLARTHDSNHTKDDPTRYLFPSPHDCELVTRWNMQATPPDVLVTNTSMLGTMLSREIEQPIFDRTRDWLRDEEDAYFFLVLDELHLVRGSAGTEVAGLVRALIHRLELHRPEMRHKLRILASSASLPLDGIARDRSLQYLHDFFGPFGTYESSVHGGAAGPDDSATAIVEGEPVVSTPKAALPLDPAPFAALLFAAAPAGQFVGVLHSLDDVGEAVRACDRTLGGDGAGELPEVARRVVEESAAVLAEACRELGTARYRATAAGDLAERIFATRNDSGRAALRGLTLARGLGDRPEVMIAEATTGFREHVFLRSIEGLFAPPTVVGEEVRFTGLGVERSTTYSGNGADLRRVFELVYCESCGEEFIGGRRGGKDDRSAKAELLPSSPDLENLPEVGGDGNYDDLSYDDFAIFWPSIQPAKGGENDKEAWAAVVLDTRNGVAMNLDTVEEGCIRGQLFRSTDQAAELRAPGTTGPNCCPACGTDYFRRSRRFRRSPIRNFRTGFARSSQLLATEVFGLLRASRGVAKAVVFSDSRQDASRSTSSVATIRTVAANFWSRSCVSSARVRPSTSMN